MHKFNREFEWDLWIHKIYIEAKIQDSRFKYIYSSKLHDFNMDWYIGIGYEQFSNFIHVSFL